MRDRALPSGARTDGRFTAAFRNPPLYYLYATPFYEALSSRSIFDRMWALRLANVPLAIVLTVLAWALAAVVLGPAWGPRTLATALVALQPGITNIEGAFNPDVLLLVWWTAGLLAMVGLVRAGPSRARVAGLFAILFGAALTNGRGLFLLGPAAVAGLAAWHRFGRPSPRAWRGATAAAAAMAAGLTVASVVRPVDCLGCHARPGGRAP